MSSEKKLIKKTKKKIVENEILEKKEPEKKEPEKKDPEKKIVENEIVEKKVEEKKENLILARSMRPLSLDEIIGQDEAINEIKTGFAKGNINHYIIISGNPGSGKTSLSRILAMKFQGFDSYLPGEIKKYDIHEINAASNNGVDYSKELENILKYSPRVGSKVKVIILDEAQQLTSQAQDVLLKVTEETSERTVIIFCTSNISKIKASLQRRALIINTKSLSDKYVMVLLERAKIKSGCELDSGPLYECLIEKGVNDPGFILQSYEKYANGVDAINCIMTSSLSEGGYDEKKLIEYISKGKWQSAAELLKFVKKEEVYSFRTYISNSLKNKLLNNPDQSSMAMSKAILYIAGSGDDLPSFIANIRLACNEISPVVIQKQ